MRSKISVRYICWIIPILFILLISVGCVIYFVVKAEVINQNERLCQTIIDQTANTLTNWIEDQIRIVQMVSKNENVIQACANPMDAEKVMDAYRYLQSIHNRYPYYENVPLVIKLKEGEKVTTRIHGKDMIAKNGQIFVDTVESKTVGKAGLHISWVKAAFEGMPYFISEVYPSLLRGNPIFVISAPVRKNGQIIGAALIAPKMSYFTERFVKSVQIGSTGNLFFFDDRGIMISHPDESLILNNQSVAKTHNITSRIIEGEKSFSIMNGKLLKKLNAIKVLLPDTYIRNQWFIASEQDMNEIIKTATSFLNILTVSGLIVFVIVSIVILFVTRYILTNPIKSASNAVLSLANYDLTVNVESNRNDEIGNMMNAMNKMIYEFRNIVTEVKSNGKHLVSDSKQMTQNINVIASSVEQMNGSIHDISATASQMSQNMNTVASAIEEMSTSIKDVERSARKGSEIANEAVKMAEKAGKTMTSLGQSANEIGEVTEVIKRIADKTTLLALNADIEAASAGEAGKGFAVVANEIKDFAHQSTSAADNIADRIGDMQEKTNQAVDVIGDIAGIIQSINQSSEIIRQALDEQMRAANEIAANSAQANGRANDIAASLAEMAIGANEISKNIGIAAYGNNVPEDQKKQMVASAVEVSTLAGQLLSLVDKFKC